jgi:hypothetical protein
MAIAELYSGNTTVSGLEWSAIANTLGPVTTNTADGVYQFFVSCSGLVAGQELQIEIYEKVTSTDAQSLIYQSNLIGPQSSIWISPSLILMHGWDLTFMLMAGTPPVGIRWSCRQVA